MKAVSHSLTSMTFSIVTIIFTVIQVLIALRLLVRFLGLSSGALIVQWVMQYSAPFVQPFQGLIPAMTLGRFVLDWNTLIALVFFSVVGAVLQQVLAHYDH